MRIGAWIPLADAGSDKRTTNEKPEKTKHTPTVKDRNARILGVPPPFTGGCLRQDIRRNRWAFGRKDVPMEVALLGLLSPTSGQLL